MLKQTNRQMMLFALVLALLAATLAACSAPAAAPDVQTVADSSAPLELDPNIDADTLSSIKDRDDVVVLDVREQWEYDEGHIPGVVHIPMNDVPARISEIPTDGTVIVSCRSGNRSSTITGYLREQGYTNVHNLDGGILGWQSAGLPVEK